MKNDAEIIPIKRGVGLIGSTEPRVHTPLLKGKSKANEVADLAEKIGLPLIPWQRWVLEDLLTVNDDGLWVKRTGIILVSRQNGKTHLARMLILAHLFLWNTKNVLGMSSNRNMALDTFRQVSYTIEDNQFLKDQVRQIRLANGQESISLLNGARYEIAAATRDAPRGKTADFLYIDELLGDPRLAAQECDCDFSTSGDIVFYNEYLEYYEKTFIKDPLERRGVDQNLWVWESPYYTRSYIVVADVARGDGKDYSTFHVIDVESNVQVAEYKGQIGTKEFGHLLVGIATEYNEALLVIENANIGWATIQVAIDRNYSNLYYSPRAEANADSYFDKYMDTSKAVAGFTMSARTRPMVVGKFQEYISEKSVTIQSKRLIEEMKVFIWKNGRAEAQQGYNDDLVMAFGIAMYIRDTALKYRQRGLDLTRSALNNISVNRTSYQGAYYASKDDNPYQIENPYGGKEDM